MYLEYLEGIRIKSLAYYHLTAVTMKNVYFCFKAAKKKEHPNIQTAAFFEMSRITKMTEKNTFKIFFYGIQSAGFKIPSRQLCCEKDKAKNIPIYFLTTK